MSIQNSRRCIFTARKKRRLSAQFTFLLLVLAVFLIAAVCICGLFVYDFALSGTIESGNTLYLFKGEKRVKRLGASDAATVNGVDMINIDVLSDYCGYGIAGDGEKRTLVFSDGSYASFSRGKACELDGSNILLEQSCFSRKGEFFVPLSFFRNYVDGLHFDSNEEKKAVYIDIASSTYSLRNFGNAPETALDADDYFNLLGVTYTPPEFKTDLTSYEAYMNPVDKDAFLILVNDENPLSADYVPSALTDLADTRKDGRTTQQMELYAAKAAEAMLIEAAANGFDDLSITSGYRSYSYQQLLFNNRVSALGESFGEKASEIAAKSVSIPGTSEHQSGLCCDLDNLPSQSQSFSESDAYAWLIENCADFGFILRFPKNKTDITHTPFEPWHFRYVGRYHAQKITEGGYCLEEYIKLLPTFSD